MNKMAAIFSSVALCLALWGCGEKTADNIKIGCTVPLSGEAAVWGNYTKKGVELAVEEYNINRATDEPRVEVIYEDTKAKAKDGISAFNKLVNIDKVEAVVDDAVSSVALAIAPIAMQKKVVVISTGATNPKLTEAGPFYFRVWNSDYEEGLFSARYCYNDLGLRTMAVMAIENDYGQGLSDVFIKQFQKYGGEIVITETYKQGDTQFRNQLLKVKESGAEAIYLVSYPEETPQILIQKHDLKISQQIIGTVPMADKSIVEKARKAAVGVIYPYPRATNGAFIDKFTQAYKLKFGEEPGTTSAEGYDAARMIIEAITSKGNDGELIRQFLDEAIAWEGASGQITFDDMGDVHKPMEMQTIELRNRE